MKNSYNKMSVFQLYDWLRKSYDSNNLYDDKSQLLLTLGTSFEEIKSLGNPVERSVEYFVSKILSGDFINVTADNPAVVDAIQQVYSWSNLVGKKSAYVRDYALLGDLFLKVRNTDSKVIIESINPDYVTTVNHDQRGNVLEIKIDIPYVGDDGKSYWYTEYWDKTYVSVWEHTLSRESSLDSLGDPTFYEFTATYGIDFVPIVHVQFRDVNKNRGQSCVFHVLEKIDEMNRILTRLHQQIFIGSNRAWFLDTSRNVDDKKPIPQGMSKTQRDGAIVQVNGAITSAIPDLPYSDLLDVVKNMAEELKQDLPELRAYSLTESGLSGKAIALLLAPAIQRAEEAESNLVRGLERANAIALTLGTFNGIFPSNLGTYERGDFENNVIPSNMKSLPIDEMATALKSLKDAGIPLPMAMQLAGFTQEEIESVSEQLQPASGASQSDQSVVNGGTVGVS